jgi:hypothetical protein
MRGRFFTHHGHRAGRSADQMVNEIHDAIDYVMERAMDAAFMVVDRVPWSADEITRRVEAFVNKHVPNAEQCVEDSWDDRR